MKFERIVILGTGPAGLTAGIYAARTTLIPLVFTGPLPGGQLSLTSTIENFPGFAQPISGYLLMETIKQQAIRLGAKVIDETIIAIDTSNPPFYMLTSTNQVYIANSLIIATGCEAKLLNLENETSLIGKGISTCATCDGNFYQDERVVVVGGSDTAITDALHLAQIAIQVIVVCRDKTLKCEKTLLDQIARYANIFVSYNSMVIKYITCNSKLIVLQIMKDGKQEIILANGIFMAIGSEPRTSLFVGINKTSSGYILTNNYVKTNVPGIFAAGDIIDISYKQAVIASATGCIAAIEAERFLCS